ncbi:MAG TPA: putative glycolipid-binding domain-containing protein [Acidobacteriota bacterium]|nr:putative glycolipid-binding domain-containing protein [Acidobacteriota bacterium]
MTEPMLWRRIDRPGHESARLLTLDTEHRLLGSAVFVYENQACRLDYTITCDQAWATVSASIKGWVGNRVIESEIVVDGARIWRLNGQEVQDLVGCCDIDLNFSPATNTLPIRRLSLEPGGRAELRAAWLRFPDFTLEPLEQVYQRASAEVYRYESGGGKFVAWLKVNEDGFVTDYPGFWRAEV